MQHIVVGNLTTVAVARQAARGAVNLHAQRLDHVRMQNFCRLRVQFTRRAGVDFLLQQTQRHSKAVQRRRRRRRAAGNVNVHRHDFIGTAPDAVQVVEDTAAIAAGAVGDTDFRVRRGLPGAQRRRTHGAGDRAGEQ